MSGTALPEMESPTDLLLFDRVVTLDEQVADAVRQIRQLVAIVECIADRGDQ